MSTLYLVRHGQASAGTDNYDRLSPLGRQQASLLGQWWQKQGFTPELVCNGSLERQRDTAQLATEGLNDGIRRDEHADLNEYNHRQVDTYYGEGVQSDNPESLTFDDYVGIMTRWRSAQPDPESVESWESFSNRGWQAIKNLCAKHSDSEHLAFFTSGGVIATVISQVLDLEFHHTIDAIWRIRNASITTLHFDGDNARLIDFNTVPHLQEHGDSSLITLI